MYKIKAKHCITFILRIFLSFFLSFQYLSIYLSSNLFLNFKKQEVLFPSLRKENGLDSVLDGISTFEAYSIPRPPF